MIRINMETSAGVQTCVEAAARQGRVVSGPRDDGISSRESSVTTVTLSFVVTLMSTNIQLLLECCPPEIMTELLLIITGQ